MLERYFPTTENWAAASLDMELGDDRELGGGGAFGGPRPAFPLVVCLTSSSGLILREELR